MVWIFSKFYGVVICLDRLVCFPRKEKFLYIDTITPMHILTHAIHRKPNWICSLSYQVCVIATFLIFVHPITAYLEIRTAWKSKAECLNWISISHLHESNILLSTAVVQQLRTKIYIALPS